MQRVFVLNDKKEPLAPCRPARARILLSNGNASVFKRYPFTIILKRTTDNCTQPIELKIDPGKSTTGTALVATFKRGYAVIFKQHITHRSAIITHKIRKRAAIRSGRRHRNTRYRKPRFANRKRSPEWLAPSILHINRTILTWSRRFMKLAPISEIHVEVNSFDTQKIVNPEISGTEYQQGTLHGYEVRQYLLEKWKRKCAYCGANGVKLQIDHIVPKQRGGTNSVTNLTIACQPCNTKKGSRTALEFGYPDVQKNARKSLKGAAYMNVIRHRLFKELCSLGVPTTAWSAALTKMNRISQMLPKIHCIDAACVGESGKSLFIPDTSYLNCISIGHGNRQKCHSDKYGFPRSSPRTSGKFKTFQTGDMVQAKVPNTFKTAGQHEGSAVCRRTGWFDIKTARGRIGGVSHVYCRTIQKADGYSYSQSHGSFLKKRVDAPDRA